MTSRATTTALAASTILVGTLSLGGTAALAAPPAPNDTKAQVVHFDAAALQSSARSAASLSASDSGVRARIAEHLDMEARNGRLLDTRDTHVAQVSDPFNASAKIDLVWDSDKSPESLTYAKKNGSSATGGAVAMGLQYGGSSNKTGLKPTGGSGYGAGFNYQNMRKAFYGCTTTWFVPGYFHNTDHKMVSCYEDWEQDRTEHFIYNRWALWTPGVDIFNNFSSHTTDFYVASRPWKGYDTKFASLNDWNPRNFPSTCDTNKDLTLQGTYGGITGSVSFPMNICDQYHLDINTHPSPQGFKIGVDYDPAGDGRT